MKILKVEKHSQYFLTKMAWMERSLGLDEGQQLSNLISETNPSLTTICNDVHAKKIG